LPGVIQEIDIWRVANLMLKRYGDEAAEVVSAITGRSACPEGDTADAAVWRRVTDAIGQLVHDTFRADAPMVLPHCASR
jgi:hypothetical protein